PGGLPARGALGPGVGVVPGTRQHAEAGRTAGALPLYFEQNVGQTEGGVDFLARGAGYTLFLTPTEAVLALAGSSGRAGDPRRAGGVNPLMTAPDQGVNTPRAPGAGVVLRMQVLGGNPAAAPVGAEPLPTKVNYFLGNDPSQWHTNIPTYSRVEYEGVYPGIDLVYYGSGGPLEDDFLVGPGPDPRQIQLGFPGVDSVHIDAGGNLLLQAGDVPLRQHKPYLYQEADGVRREVAGNFVLQAAGSRYQVGFAIGAYDPSRPLVIDPVLLGYSTYLGAGAGDYADAVAVDDAGSAYLTG